MRSSLDQIFILLIVVVSISCSKESSNKFRQNEFYYENSKIESCGSVTTQNNLFARKNLLETFKCLEWDKKYPQIYNFIGDYNDEPWNMLVQPLNSSFEENTKRKSKTRLNWLSVKKNGTSSESLKNIIQEVVNSQNKILLPEISGESQKAYWLKIIEHYDFLLRFIEVFEKWKKNYTDKDVMDVKFSLVKPLIETTELISQNYIAQNDQNKILKSIVLYNEPGYLNTPWPVYYANLYINNASAEMYLPHLLLTTKESNLLAHLPKLDTVLNSGIDCPIYKQDGVVNLKENYLDIASRISGLSQSDSILEVLDLKMKLWGIYDYCDINELSVSHEKFMIANNSLESLAKILQNPIHFDFLRSMLIATESQKLTLDSLFKFYSSEWINKILMIWLKVSQDNNFNKLFVNIISSFDSNNFTALVDLLLSKEMEFLAKDLSKSELDEEAFWKMVISVTNFNLNNPAQEFNASQWIPFFFPKETLEDYLNVQETIDSHWSEFKESFSVNKSLHEEIYKLIDSKQWMILFDYLLLGRVVKSEPNNNRQTSTYFYKEFKNNPTNVKSSLNLPLESCFDQLLKLQFKNLSKLVSLMPDSCKNVDLRNEHDFAFRVIQDLAKLNDQNVHIPLKANFLRFVGELMLFGQKHERGFTLFWEDILKVFFTPEFKDLFLDYYEKKPAGFVSLKNINIKDAFAVLPKSLQLIKSLLSLNIDLSKYNIIKNIDRNKLNELRLGSLFEFMLFLENNNLTADFENILLSGDIKGHKYLQLMLNDLSSSKEPLDVVNFYEKKLNLIINNSFARGVAGINSNELEKIKDLQTQMIFFKKLNALSFRGYKSSLHAMTAILKPFTAAIPLGVLGKTLNLILPSVSPSPLTLILTDLAQKGLVTELSRISREYFESESEMSKLVGLLNSIDWSNTQLSILNNNFIFHGKKYIEYLNQPKNFESLKRLSLTFSKLSIYDKNLFQDSEFKKIIQLLNSLNKTQAEKLFDYYFSSYGAPLVRISNQAQKALEGVYP